MQKYYYIYILLAIFLLFSNLCFAQSSEESSVEESSNESSNETENDVDCSQHNSCDSCTDESGCVWCSTSDECVNGGFFGPSSILPSCSNWKYKQCTINGRWYTWYPLLVLIVILLIACCCGLITFFFCNPCVYAYKQYKQKGAYVKWEDMQSEIELDSREPTEEQLRRESLRKKWNL